MLLHDRTSNTIVSVSPCIHTRRGMHKSPCACMHMQVYVLLHDRPSNTIVSAGADGYVRLWDFNKINDAEPETDGHTLAITPVDEVQVAQGGSASVCVCV